MTSLSFNKTIAADAAKLDAKGLSAAFLAVAAAILAPALVVVDDFKLTPVVCVEPDGLLVACFVIALVVAVEPATSCV